MDAMSSQASAEGLLEREREREALDAQLDEAAAGRGSVVLIEGAAGIGKSRLLALAAARASAGEATALTATCSELERQFSYGTTIQLLGPAADAARADGTEPFAGTARLARSLFEPSRPGPQASHADATFGLYVGLQAMLAELAEAKGPIVACVDDLQWCDEPSAGFLAFLARRLRAMPVALVVGLRTGEPLGERAAAMVADLHEHHPHTVLRPQPLSIDAAASWVRRDHPDASDRVCAAFAEASGGNPFYLRELLAGAGPGDLEAESVAGLGRASPESVRRSVAARIEHGGADAVALSQAIAVLGSADTLHDAGRLASLEPSAAAAAADTLLELDILAAVDRPSFVHPVVAAAVRDAISPARRALAHREAARILDHRGAADEAVASQLLEAAPGSDGWAIAALERAGARAIERGSPATAARYLTRALDEAPEPDRRGAILAALGLAEAAAGEDGGAARVEEAVALIAEPAGRASALFDLATVYVHQGRYPRSAAAASRGLEELGSPADPLAESLEVARDNSTVWVDLTDSGATLERAQRAISKADPAKPAGRSALANAAVALAFTDSSCERIGEVARRAIQSREPTADPFDGHAFPVAAYALVVAGDPQAAEDAMAVAVEAAQSRGSVLEVAAAVHARSVARLELGRVADAVVDAEGAVEAGRWGWGATLPFAHSRLVLGYIEQGRLDEAERALELPGGADRWAVNATYGTWLLAGAELALAKGDAEQAHGQLELCGRLADLVHARNPGVIAWRGAAARALLALGKRSSARELAGQEVALARHFGCRGPLGAALRVAALTDDSDAIASLRESVAVLAGSQCRLELARSQVELGAALRRAGSVRDAKEPLRAGLDLAHRCGASVLADRAREELRIAGARPRRDALRGVDALTPSERRVAALAAEGLSNPEIARRLTVTRRTVEMHLSATYTKLEIGSRDELDSALAVPGG